MNLLRFRPARPVARTRRPVYPTLLAAGMVVAATACGGANPPAASGGAPPPVVVDNSPAPAQTIATSPDDPAPVEPDPVMLDGEAPAPFESR